MMGGGNPVPSGLPPAAADAPLGSGWVRRLLILVLGVNVVLSWMAIQGAFVLAQAVWRALAGQVFAGAEPGRIGRQLVTLRLAQFVAWLAAAGLFLAWIHGAHRTLGALGFPGARSPGDAVRAFLVPGPNLVRPPRVVLGLWRASAGTPGGSVPWVTWWWSLCLVGLVLTLWTALAIGGLHQWTGIGEALPLVVLTECVRIAAAVLTIVVVHRIDDCQCQLFGRRIGRPGAAR